MKQLFKLFFLAFLSFAIIGCTEDDGITPNDENTEVVPEDENTEEENTEDENTEEENTEDDSTTTEPEDDSTTTEPEDDSTTTEPEDDTTTETVTPIYEFGDLYTSGTDSGIVYAFSDDNTIAYIFSLEQASDCVLALATAQGDDVDLLYSTGLATSSTDGAANTAAIVASTNYSEENFPAVAWAVGLGDGWYLPADDELVALLTAVTNVGETIADAVTDDYECYAAINTVIYNAIDAAGGTQFTTNSYYYPSRFSAAAKANLKEIQTDNGAINIHNYKGAIANPRCAIAIKQISAIE